MQYQNDPGSIESVDNQVGIGNEVKGRWRQLDLPVQIGIVGGVVVLLALTARYILPVLVASIGIGLIFAILFLPYWIPTIIAFFRGHPSKLAIAAVNFFFGWTFIGWFVALVWALSNESRGGQQSVVVNTIVSNNAIGHAPQPMVAPQQYQVGDVLNGQRFNGLNWEPLATPGVPPPTATPAAAALPQPGDVLNGHRFDGANWVPVATPSPLQPGQVPPVGGPSAPPPNQPPH